MANMVEFMKAKRMQMSSEEFDWRDSKTPKKPLVKNLNDHDE